MVNIPASLFFVFNTIDADWILMSKGLITKEGSGQTEKRGDHVKEGSFCVVIFRLFSPL